MNKKYQRKVLCPKCKERFHVHIDVDVELKDFSSFIEVSHFPTKYQEEHK